MATLRELEDNKIERVRQIKWNDRAYMRLKYTKIPWEPDTIDAGAWGKLYDPRSRLALEKPENEGIDVCLAMMDFEEDAWEEYTGIQCIEE